MLQRRPVSTQKLLSSHSTTPSFGGEDVKQVGFPSGRGWIQDAQASSSLDAAADSPPLQAPCLGVKYIS